MKNARLSKLQTDNVNSLKGYTLIEIIVVIGIMALIFTFGYATYRDFSRRQALAAVVRSFKGDLRLAQEYAASGKKPEGCGGDLSGYRVSIWVDKYSIKSVCGGLVDIGKTDITFPDGITVSSTNPSFTFKILGQGTDIVGGSPLVITLTQVATENEAKITITNTGEIR
jgi:prepilin-type N-terminal cleavage/methylation domain-containing protein